MPIRVPKVTPHSRTWIEQTAEAFVAAVSPDSLLGLVKLPVKRIAEFQLSDLFGVEFDVDDLPPGIEGRFEGNILTLATDVYDQLLNDTPRSRFTVVHELGHCALHREILQFLNTEAQRGQVALFRRDTIECFRDPEWQANVFASAALMPLGAVKAVEATLPSQFKGLLPDRLAAKMGVSIEAARIRVRSLKERGVI